ncbi:hypothetical protein JCM3774_005222, partial [Rhodotorula dairenensis]
AISRSSASVKEKLIARMQMRWCLVNPVLLHVPLLHFVRYPRSAYLRELACWRYYAPVVHRYSLRLELALHLVEHLMRHHLVTEPQVRAILRAYDEQVERIEREEASAAERRRKA